MIQEGLGKTCKRRMMECPCKDDYLKQNKSKLAILTEFWWVIFYSVLVFIFEGSGGEWGVGQVVHMTKILLALLECIKNTKFLFCQYKYKLETIFPQFQLGKTP